MFGASNLKMRNQYELGQGWGFGGILVKEPLLSYSMLWWRKTRKTKGIIKRLLLEKSPKGWGWFLVQVSLDNDLNPCTQEGRDGSAW